MVLGEVCHFYGWRTDYVLSMPARHFWLMYSSYQKIKAAERVELIDIGAIAICGSKYYKHIRGFYASQIHTKDVPTPLPKERRPVMDNADSRNFFTIVFRNQKRQSGR